MGERIDQGFFRNMVNKIGRAELSHARWLVGRENGEYKVCAFTDDEQHIMIVMQSGYYYKLPIQMGDQQVTQAPLNLLGNDTASCRPGIASAL